MESRPYTVHIYESEAKLISKWTLRYPNIETGGDLFGLWLNANEIVIQAVLGPGQNCRRTATSFFQDEQYLSEVGESLTQEQGLCNIGSWHSHHTMNLPDPSRGDKDTVWKHLPTPGRFVLLIAAIKTETEAPKVEMGFNLFESTVKGNEITSMKLNVLQGVSPVRANKGISSKIHEGAESDSKKKDCPEPDVQSSLIRPEVNKRLRAKIPEVSRSDVKPNEKYDDCSDFFKGERHQAGRQGHRRQLDHDHRRPLDQDHRRPPNQDHQRPLNQGGTCDGAPSYPVSYNTFQHSYYREFRHRRPHYHTRYKQHAYSYRVHDLPDGRQRITLYHYDHEVGLCGDCFNTSPTLTKNGKLRVRHGQGDIDCCSCAIL